MNLLADGFLPGAIVLVLAMAMLPALRRRSAALRHLVLTVALTATLLAPVASWLAPAWDLPAPVAVQWPAMWPDPAPAGPSAASFAVVHPAEAGPRQPFTGVPLDRLLGLVWLAGLAASLLVIGAGLTRLRWLMSKGQPLTRGVWADEAAALTARTSLPLLRCVITPHPTLLATIGTRRPVVLVPAAASAWPADRVALVLAHEAAHVRRGDWPIQLIAELVRALHWFNPLAWIACVRLRREAEMACDDAVLAGGAKPDEYADALLAAAYELRGARAVVPAMAVVHPSGFERRVARMLSSTINRRPVSRRTIVAVAILGLAVLLPLAGVAARQARASVTGSVSDPQRGMLPGVRLTLTHSVSGQKKDIESDSTGRFAFADLEPGDYLLEAQLPGFAVYRTTATISGDGRATALDLTLQVGTLLETISVRAPATGPREAPNRAVDQDAFRRLEESKRKRAAQVCRTTPERPSAFIGGNVRAPAKFVDVRPSYPEHLRTSGVSGFALLEARIGVEGVV
jgi:beta-lactamase regulating signal transducer with metallopeptidase domain